MALTIYRHLAPTLKKEYTFAPPLCLHGLFKGELYLYISTYCNWIETQADHIVHISDSSRGPKCATECNTDGAMEDTMASVIVLRSL
jgi:hypothetical protein